jgi:hypothetical protein
VGYPYSEVGEGSRKDRPLLNLPNFNLIKKQGETH